MDNQDYIDLHNDTQVNGKVNGCKKKNTFTKENARQAQLSGAKVRKLRNKVRGEMVAALAAKDGFSFAEEIFKAIKTKDEDYLNILEKASRMVGFNFDQSDEAVRNVKVHAEAKVKSNNVVKFVLDDNQE